MNFGPKIQTRLRSLAPTPVASLWSIAIARIVIGVLWLFSLRWKLPPDFDGGSERSLRQWLQLEVEHPTFAPYGRFVETVIQPNFTLFAWLLFFCELVVGISLLLGLFTRGGALLGFGLSLNLGIGLANVPGEWPWAYVMLAMWHGVFFATGAGRAFGIDGRLRGNVLNTPLRLLT